MKTHSTRQNLLCVRKRRYQKIYFKILLGSVDDILKVKVDMSGITLTNRELKAIIKVERRTLIKVAQMYYLEHMRQDEIAKRLDVRQTTVSKYLERALDTGIVTITVATENFEDIETAMERRFGLKECFIVPKSYDMLAVKQAMGRAGLKLLRRIAANRQVIGLAWGTSVRELTHFAEKSKLPKIDSDFVPIDGGPENIDSEYHVNTLCYELAKAFGGKCHYIYAPAITRTAEIRNAIIQDAFFCCCKNIYANKIFDCR